MMNDNKPEPKKTIWVERWGYEKLHTGATLVEQSNPPINYKVTRAQNILSPVVNESVTAAKLQDLIDAGITVNIAS